MTDPAQPAGLARRRALARAALCWEAVWPRLWPILGALGLCLILALLDLPRLLPAPLHLLALLLAALALCVLAWRNWRGFRAPDPAAAERRLERDSGLAHRPLATLGDRPAGADPAALAVWAAHQRRAAAQLDALRVTPPRPGLAARDPRALRAAVLLGLFAALVIAGAEAPERLRRALLPQFAALPAALGLRLEAWVTPPAYTGAPPIFLHTQGGAVTVPAGSRLQVALSGGTGGVPQLLTPTGSAAFAAADALSFTAEAILERGGRLAVLRDGGEIAQWTLTVQADAPPSVTFAEPPGKAARGLGIRLPWRAEDDWGLATLRAELRLATRLEAAPLVLDLPLPTGNPKQARGAATPDLSAHPWAGLEVRVQLLARDGGGQEGGSEIAGLTLPERSFTHPVARQAIAVRKALSLDPTQRRLARQAIETILGAPEAFEHDTATYLALRSAGTRLMLDQRADAVAEVQETLWEVALALEEGRDARTRRSLAQAREALRQALEEAARNPAPPTPEDPAQQQQRAELERRIQELREAIRQHLEALAEKLQRENAEALPFDPQSRMLDQREMARRAQRLQDAAREGRTEDAKKELAELEEMLQALEEGRTQRADTAERQQRRERGQRQMGVVQDLVKRESELLDRGHQRAEQAERERGQRNRSPLGALDPSGRARPEPGPPPARPPAAEDGARGRAEREQDARRQRALRRALGELMQQFGDLTGEVPEALGRADQAMREAQEALRQGGDARDAQQRALRALQEGGRQMAQSMQRQFGPPQPGDEEGEGEGEGIAGDPQPGNEGQEQARNQGEGRDPLGRRSRDVNGNADNGADTRVPDQAELLRTRELLEELRRRGAQKERPAEELDYIDRLLKRF
jgi:uncharacterized protein (TIGR02302 family)